MFNHEIFAVSLARTIDLIRTGVPVAQQKTSLRAVHALTSVASAMVRVYQDMLTVDDIGIPDTLPCIPLLIQQIRDHGVAEIAIARGATPPELLALVRGLAAEAPPQGGVQRIKRRLRNARSTAIMVIPVQPDEAGAGPRGRSVTEAFEAKDIEEAVTESEQAEAAAAQPPSRPSFDLPAIAHTIDMAFDLTDPTGAPMETPVKPPAPEKPAQPLEPQVISGEAPLNSALARVAHDPFGDGILDRLTDLSKQIQRALRDDQIQPALHAMAAVIAWEPEAPEGSPRTAYAIVLRRTLTRELLTQLAQFVADPRLGPEAIKVLQRGRGDAAEVLLGLVANAEDMRERKAYMLALRGMPEGVAQVIHMLGHQKWFVVRNVADLMGELRIEEAVPGLAECLTHDDLRVRRSAAVALAKIGTAATAEPLRRVLKAGDAELRALVAGSVGGPKSRALAMPLVAFAEEEQDPDVLSEYYRALGRIGTPDAVQALAKAAQAGGRLLGRRHPGARTAAVDGLRIAGNKAAVAALRTLAEDGDRTVRDPARRALDELKVAGS
jgi:HEAT repeat protein